jgi:glycosyltransferase involved in cell wall biosynthesis
VNAELKHSSRRSNFSVDRDVAESARLDSANHRLRGIRMSLIATREALQTVGFSAALWMLYVPHYVLLRSLGPRRGMVWVRCAANLHWLLTFFGAQRSARRAIAEMKPHFNTSLSVSSILRRHLLLKHECFARVRVYSLHAADGKRDDMQWICSPECVDALPGATRDRGLIIVGYHFNFFQTFAAGLAKFFPNDDLVQLRYRTSRCVETASSPIVQLAFKKAMEADRRAGANVFYIDDFEAIIQLYRLLRQRGVVAVTADGGAAGDFVDVPFFDGTLRVPSGWAKLAAGAKADILLVCDKELKANSREGLFYNHVKCGDASDAAVFQAVAESIRVLERRIKDEPWGWHPWQRLQHEVDEQGVRRYSLKQYGFDEGTRLKGDNSSQSSAESRDTEPAKDFNPGPIVRRVAVVANSLPPYRVQLHEKIVANYPALELWSLTTHSNAYKRWGGLKPPEAIRHVEFSSGEPTNEQPLHRYSIREWKKGGRIIRWLREHQIDAVFVQGCGDLGRLRIIRWCRANGIDCFLTGDFNIQSDNHRAPKRWLKQLVYGRAVRWSTGLMPCGEHGLSLLNRYGGRDKVAYKFPFVPEVKLFANPPGNDVQWVRNTYGLAPNRRRIVFSARLMTAKRPDLAVRAFVECAGLRPEWDLVMVGDGPMRSELEEIVPSRLRERVIWTGFVNDMSKLAGIYANSDLLLLPSDHEPWGVVVVEAAAAGLAIVASDRVGAVPELVHDKVNGAIFPAGNLRMLKEALLAATDKETVDQMKGNSRDVFRRWQLRDDAVANFGSALGMRADASKQQRSERPRAEPTHAMHAPASIGLG